MGIFVLEPSFGV